MRRRRGTNRWVRRGAVGIVATLAVSLAAVGCDGAAAPNPAPSPTARKTVLTFGVFGAPEEVSAFRSMVAAYNAQAVATKVDLVTWPDRDAMIHDVEKGTPLPDLYMLGRRDLPQVTEQGLNQPLFELLDERGISYGDNFSRDAVAAFSGDNDLQCMPYSVSPMVMYYNRDLIDFEQLASRGKPVPDANGAWRFEAFRAAAKYASRPRRGSKGVYIDPTLRSLAPFIYSAGGNLYDDDDDPTSLQLSDDDDVTAIDTARSVLGDPQLTLSARQLARATPLQWFKRGRLGMIEGFRSLTPELRRRQSLNFDVVSMPVIDDRATVGEFTGLCISSAGSINKTADFLVYALSDENFASVAEAGYIVPANETVARSAAFLQPGSRPEHAAVFNFSIDAMEQLPILPQAALLNVLVDPLLRQLIEADSIEEVQSQAAQIDELSRSVLDPDYVPPTEEPVSPSASEVPSEAPSSSDSSR